MFGISAGTSPQSAQECVDVVIEELARMAENGPTEAEINLAREHIKGSLTLSLEASSSRMIRLGRSEYNLSRQMSIEEIEREVDAVTAEGVHALARELFVPERLGLCVLGPVEESSIHLQGAVA